MFDTTFPGGIVNYNFDGSSYPPNANALYIRESKFKRACKKYEKALKAKGIELSKAAYVKFDVID